jgi:hypothetical protein
MIGEPGLTAILLLAPASRTATGTGTAVDMRDYTGRGHVLFNCAAAASGTSPTIDGKLRHSTDGTTWADVTGATFTQVTTTGGVEGITVDCDQLRRYVEGYVTIGGTAVPTFVCSMEMLAQKALV